MLDNGVATCYLNLSVISSCCFEANLEFIEMFLMIHLPNCSIDNTCPLYIKQLSESVAQIMSYKLFLKTPSAKLEQTNMDC